jgi:predicted O-methyltransferase YrrM
VSIQSGQDIASNLHFEVDGVQFATGFVPRSPSLFTVVKSPDMVDRYRQLLASYPRPRLVELGIAFGGSVALFALLADPERFLAVELSADRLPELDAFIEQRGLGERVHCRYGVDQADRATLARLVGEVFGDAPLDLVFDDASHLYGPSRDSFDALFPRLRPGGRYLVEDWKHDHQVALVIRRALADPTSEGHEAAKALVAEAGDGPAADAPVPLSQLAADLVEAVAVTEGVIAGLEVNDQWVVVERGPAEMDPATFRLADLLAV